MHDHEVDRVLRVVVPGSALCAGAQPGQFGNLRLDDLDPPRGFGAPYKSRAGFRFPYGDYFGITADSRGTSYLIWSEGTSYDGPGGTWWAHGR